MRYNNYRSTLLVKVKEIETSDLDSVYYWAVEINNALNICSVETIFEDLEDEYVISFRPDNSDALGSIYIDKETNEHLFIIVKDFMTVKEETFTNLSSLRKFILDAESLLD